MQVVRSKWQTSIAVNEANWGAPKITLSITDGKVLEGEATTPSGMPADSIVFFVNVQETIPIKSRVSVVQALLKMSNFETREYEKEDNATLSSFCYICRHI